MKNLFEMKVFLIKQLQFFAEKTNNDIKKIFVCVFPSNYVIRFINFHSMMIESKNNHPFITMNTDRSDKKGTYWWSLLDLHTKKAQPAQDILKTFYFCLGIVLPWRDIFKMLKRHLNLDDLYYLALRHLNCV